MNRPYVTMKQNVGNNIQDTSGTFLQIIGGYIQDRYQEVKRRLNLMQNTTTDYIIPTVSGQQDYTLPEDFHKEVLVFDTTNNLVMKRLDDQGLIRNNYSYFDMVAPIDVVQPQYMQYYVVFDRPTITQPASSVVVTVSSSSSSDITQTCTVRGLNENGIHDYEILSLNGTNTVSSTVLFSKILGFSKSAATVGVVTLKSGSTTIAQLSREALESREKIMRLISTPTGVFNIRVDYLQKEMPLSQDYDYPIIDCSDVLEAGATADGWRYKRQFSKAQVYEQIFEKKLANLAWDNENQATQIHLFKPARPNRMTTF